MLKSQNVALIAGLCAPVALADVVISNINAPNGSGTNLGTKDAGFRMPAGASFRLTSVTVRAEPFNPSNASAAWSIWAGDSMPTTKVCDLILPPGAAGAPVGWVTLTPDASTNLSAGGVYWIRMDNTDAGVLGSDFIWAGTAGVLPSGIATHVGYLFNGNPSGNANAYKLEGEFSGAIIDFDRAPGIDGYIGTADDVPIAAPTTFVSQTAQLTTAFQSQGVTFYPIPSVNDLNEILNNDTFPVGALSSEPNLFTSFGPAGGVLSGRFLRPVYAVSADIGLTSTPAIFEILDASGAVIDSVTGLREHVTLVSDSPIASFRVRGGGSTVAIDDLELSFLPLFDCLADLSGSSDPNDPAYGVPDGIVDASDFFFFLDRFAQGCN